jgi:hypothetical protein
MCHLDRAYGIHHDHPKQEQAEDQVRMAQFGHFSKWLTPS